MAYQPHYFTEVREAQSRAYVPYSKFKVGAFLKPKTDSLLRSQCRKCSVSYDHLCRKIKFSIAISQGYRPGDFESITITVDADEPSSPCGACRQVLKELCDDDMPVYMTNQTGKVIESTVEQLLPLGFSGKDLN